MTAKKEKQKAETLSKLMHASTMIDEVREIAESVRQDEHELRTSPSQETSVVGEMNSQLLASAISILETAQNYITMVGNHIATYDENDAEAHERAGIMLENYVGEIMRESGFGLIRYGMLTQQAKSLLEGFNATDDSQQNDEKNDMTRAQAICMTMPPGKVRVS